MHGVIYMAFLQKNTISKILGKGPPPHPIQRMAGDKIWETELEIRDVRMIQLKTCFLSPPRQGGGRGIGTSNLQARAQAQN
jgi:hypothetical protein